MILFKHGESQEKQFWQLSPKTQMIVVDAAHFIKSKFGVDCIVTSVIREDGIHAAGRACDIRSFNLKDEEIAKLDHYLNDKYPYGKINPRTGQPYKTCYYHKSDKSDEPEYHFHLQNKFDGSIHPK